MSEVRLPPWLVVAGGLICICAHCHAQSWGPNGVPVPGSHGTVTAKVTDWYGAIGQATTGY